MAATFRALNLGWSAAGPDMTMKATEHELKTLLMDHLAGDPEAYRAFLEKVSVLLRQFVGRRLFRLRRSEQDVEDIVQETLIAIHARRHTYDGETPVTCDLFFTSISIACNRHFYFFWQILSDWNFLV